MRLSISGDRATNGWAAYLIVYCDTTGNVSGFAAIVRARSAFVAGDRCCGLVIAQDTRTAATQRPL
jgi:hypothetical protein